VILNGFKLQSVGWHCLTSNVMDWPEIPKSLKPQEVVIQLRRSSFVRYSVFHDHEGDPSGLLCCYQLIQLGPTRILGRILCSQNAGKCIVSVTYVLKSVLKWCLMYFVEVAGVRKPAQMGNTSWPGRYRRKTFCRML
jgi:hypothetical protein